MAYLDVGSLYIVQMLALGIKFRYGGLIILGFIVGENVKLKYGRLPGIVTTNVLLRYGGLQCVIPFIITFKYGRTAFSLG